MPTNNLLQMDRWAESPLRPAVERFAAANRYADVGWGAPVSGEGWFRYEALSDQGVADAILTRITHEYQTTPQVTGTYTFRAAHYLPLGLAGYLFAAERRVPRLRGNLAILDRQFLNGLRLLDSQAIVLESDPAAGSPGFETVRSLDALTERLFAEVADLVEPVLGAFEARKLVARANAWGILIDFLAEGFLTAGRLGLGLDAAWAEWERAIDGRPFPIRRRPRRVQFEVDGRPDEVMVRAHCCLNYTLPQAKEAAHRYCATCYLESDDCRIQRLIDWNRASAAKG